MEHKDILDKTIFEILSLVIYEIRTSTVLINEYAADANQSDVVIRQSFLIERVLDSVSDFTYLHSENGHLTKSREDVAYILESAIHSCKALFTAKRIRVTLDKKFSNLYVFIDRQKILNSVLSILVYIFLESKMHGKINISGTTLDYEEDINVFTTDEAIALSRVIQIDINFMCEKKPEWVRRQMFSEPIIKSKNSSTNNIFLYTAANIIELHNGKIWSKATERGECITILLPLESDA